MHLATVWTIALVAFLTPSAARADPARLLAGFEQETELFQWRLEGASVERVRQHATQGRHSLQITLRPGAYPGLSLQRGSPLLMGWSGYDLARLDIFNPQPEPLAITIRMDDVQSINYGSRYNEAFTLRPGKNTIELPLTNARTTDKSRKLNLDRLKLLMIFAANLSEPHVLFLDNFRLEKIAPTQARSDVRAFDFGPRHSPVFEGFTQVTGSDRYDKSRGWGWTSTNALGEFDNELPDSLCRDFICGIPATDFTTGFALDLPKDRYTVIVCGHSLFSPTALVPVRTYRVLAEDEERFRVPVHAGNFFTEQFLFRGINHDWWPGKDVWREEILPKFPVHSFEVDVTDGRLDLQFDSMAVFWLAVWPSARAKQSQAWLNDVRATQRKEFYEKNFFLQPYAPPPNPEKIILSAARGQTVSAFFAGKTPPTLTWRERPEGIRAELRAVRLMERPVARGIYRIEPTTLLPVTNRPHATQFCLTVRVSPRARPGTYRGEVGAIPVTLRIWPFELPATRDLKMTYGWYYGPPREMNYYFGLFPDKTRDYQRIFESELRDMAEHGFNSIMVSAPRPVVDPTNRVVTLNTAPEEAFLRACQQAGLVGKHRVMMSSLRIAQVLAHELDAPEFSAAFVGPFLEALAQVREWARTNDFPIVACVVDEPREQALNPWNRNFAQTKQFLELYRKAGLPTVVTLLGDDSFGKSYLPLLPLMDVAATHPSSRSRGIIETAARGKPELWIYNAGMNRFSFGFHPWALGATGRWEWHYQMWTQAYDPFARSFENPWSPGWGAVMPSPQGPVPTVAYEKVRAGIDDYRYIQLLEQRLQSARGRKAKEAEKFLAEIRGRIPRFPEGKAAGLDDATLDDWREKIAGFIVALEEGAE